MGKDNRSGSCVTEKVRYPSDVEAAAALDRVRQARAERPDGSPPERQFYFCRHCDGWHLSSKPPLLGPEPPPKHDGETWHEYALRLEHRIKEQRDHLAVINEMRADAGNRHERKRIAGLLAALGRMTERWDTERQARLGLVQALESAKASCGANSQPSSAGICSTCGKSVEKRYGGEGRYLPECIDCWTKAEPSHAPLSHGDGE